MSVDELRPEATADEVVDDLLGWSADGRDRLLDWAGDIIEMTACTHDLAGREIPVGAILSALVARVERIELTGEPERRPNNLMRSFGSLPVRLHAA